MKSILSRLMTTAQAEQLMLGAYFALTIAVFTFLTMILAN